MWPDFGRGHGVTTKTTCTTTTTMTATVTSTTTTTATTTTGRGLEIRGVNWKWTTATTFPQSDARCNFSHELAAQKAGSQGCQRHGEEGRGRPDSALFQFHPGSHRFTVSCLSAPQSTDFHGCITSRFRELCPLRRIHLLRPSDTALITEISHRSHQEFMSPFRVPSLSGRESQAVYLAPHFPGDPSIPSPPGHSSGRNPHISDLVEAAWA